MLSKIEKFQAMAKAAGRDGNSVEEFLQFVTVAEDYDNSLEDADSMERNELPPEDYYGYRQLGMTFDIGMLDIDKLAQLMGFEGYEDLIISYSSPAYLWEELAPLAKSKFIEALKSSSLKARDMSDEEITDIMDNKIVAQKIAAIDSVERLQAEIKAVGRDENSLEELKAYIEIIADEEIVPHIVAGIHRITAESGEVISEDKFEVEVFASSDHQAEELAKEELAEGLTAGQSSDVEIEDVYVKGPGPITAATGFDDYLLINEAVATMESHLDGALEDMGAAFEDIEDLEMRQQLQVATINMIATLKKEANRIIKRELGKILKRSN